MRALEAVGLEERRPVERLVVGADLDLMHLAQRARELVHRVAPFAFAHRRPRTGEHRAADVAHDEPLAELGPAVAHDAGVARARGQQPRDVASCSSRRVPGCELIRTT